jgi:ADP-ribose pyrophosphatase YjhB (NUDIX family)
LTEKNYKNPLLTVDIIIETPEGIVLVERKNEPKGWALPGGFVDYGESLEASAVREAKEETSLTVTLTEQFHAYSAPNRDPRHHTVTTVYIASANGTPQGADDARSAKIFSVNQLPEPIVFDHSRILNDYYRNKKGETKKEIFKSDYRV